jgi:hypothetical protein
MILSKPQQTIAEDPARFKVVSAGRRFGKTVLSIREIAYRARIPNREVFYITTSYRAAKMIVWKPLKHRLLDLRWVSKVNESELSILLKNGTTISLKGSEDPDKLRGVSLDYAVIDEAASCQLDQLWGEIIRPALSDRQGGALFIGTPQGRSNPFYDLYQFAVDPSNQGWSAYQYTTADGGFVPLEEIEAAKRDMTEKQFKQEFLASFETDESRVAWAFDRKTNVIEQPKQIDTSTIYVGMDFNVNPMSAAIAVRSGETLTVIDELTIYASSTDEIADEIQTRYPRSRVFVYPDPAGSARKTSANGMTDHKILENRGFVVKAPRRHDAVRDRINAINARFRNAVGEHQLFVTKNCVKTIESLEKHSFKPGTSIPDKDSGYDHQFDALNYMVAYLFPIRGTQIETQPTRWGHAIQ